MKITVIGGTGLVGGMLVVRLREQGHEVTVAARSTGVDLLTGEGLVDALAGSETVIDVSNSGYSKVAQALHFFETSNANLFKAERETGIAHHIALSAVGTSVFDSGYFQAKQAQERLIVESGVPFTIVRSTPFFEYIYHIVDEGGEEDIVRLPPVLMQPIAANDVAKALSHVATATPGNGTIEVAGPDTHRLPDLAERILTANEDTRRMIIDPEALYFGARFNDEPLIGGRHPRFGSVDFDKWLRSWIAAA